MPPGIHVLAPPAAKPATNLPPSYAVHNSFTFPATYFAAVAEFGVLPTSPRTRLPGGDVGGRRGISPNYGDALHPRRGGSPSEEPGTLRFCDARLLHIDKMHALPNRDGGVSTPHPQGAPCAIHAWRHSLSGSFPFFPNSAPPPRPAPPLSHPRGSALHHLIF
ncbi:hypothetical protein BC827DRAFT_1267076 [Russula dissimulans]|nr:hypothetical protein BC827DRAFT_1267076 [Russula dissimulans]